MSISYEGASYILSAETEIPENRVSTSDLLKVAGCERFGIDPDYIRESMGINSVSESVTANPSDLAIPAARRAIERAGVDPERIGMLVWCGIDSDYSEPGTAHVVQKACGARNAICVDVRNACHGLMNGLQYVDAMIHTGAVEYGLLVTGEQPSRVRRKTLDEVDGYDEATFRKTMGAFTTGDSGGAVVLGREGDVRIRKLFFDSKEAADLCYYRYGMDGRIDGQMLMAKICRATLRMQIKLFRRAMEELSWAPQDIDHVVCHQVGRLYHAHLCECLGLGLEKARSTYQELGNLITNTIPLGLNLLWNQAHKNDKAYVVASGSGISISHLALEF